MLGENVINNHNNRTNHQGNSQHNSNNDINEDDYDDISSSSPSSDHSLSYVILSTGMIIVALATSESELYITFPNMMTALEATTLADSLSRTLKADANHLFQITY